MHSRDEEEVELLKSWLQENGKPMIVGVVVTVICVFAWQFYKHNKIKTNQEASSLYKKIIEEIGESSDINPNALSNINSLYELDENHAYSAFAKMLLAKTYADKQEYEKAIPLLQESFNNSADEAIREIIRLRLVRLLLVVSRFDEAQKLLSGEPKKGYELGFYELSGDLLLAKNQTDSAKEKYLKALEFSNPVTNNDLNNKISDLGIFSLEDEEQNITTEGK